MPDAAPNEAENVEQPRTVMTRPRPEVKRKAYPAWRPDLCGHAVLAAAALKIVLIHADVVPTALCANGWFVN